MSVKIGHASMSEKGTTNGTKGDQTGREVCIANWFDPQWDYMAIHPDALVREKHAQAVEAGCANDNIGYGQGDRNTLNDEAKAVRYDLSKITKPCNTDCSEFQNVCAVASGAAGVTHASNGWTTSSMKAALKAAGYKIIEDKTYLSNADYCVRGAIYVKSGSHTVSGLSNGSKAAKTLEKAGITETSTPGTSTSGSGSTKETIYIVVRGDTLSGIASKFGTTYQVLAAYNGISNPNRISVGQEIRIPTSGTGTGSAMTYTVARGDTLSAIAARYGTTVEKIVAANKEKYPSITASHIVAGWELTIPG